MSEHRMNGVHPDDYVSTPEATALSERYFIRKSTRTSRRPYEGPSCEKAGVPRGKWYDHEGEARQDAAKLSAVNPVGFDVVIVQRTAPSVPKGDVEAISWPQVEREVSEAVAMAVADGSMGEVARLQIMATVRAALTTEESDGG